MKYGFGPRAKTIFHGMSLLSSTYCYNIDFKSELEKLQELVKELCVDREQFQTRSVSLENALIELKDSLNTKHESP